MKISNLIYIFLFSITTSYAQTIPDFTGETADNKNIKIPDDLKGKYSLLCFASSQKAQTELESWLDPVYQKFIAMSLILLASMEVIMSLPMILQIQQPHYSVVIQIGVVLFGCL